MLRCAYNQLNGTYCADHGWLCRSLLREQWGFGGLVVTDWFATNDKVLPKLLLSVMRSSRR